MKGGFNAEQRKAYDDVMKGGFNAEQRKAYEAVMSGRNVLITGQGGVGKSWVVGKITSELKRRNISYAVTASTGAAAILIGGITLHRWAGIGLGTGSAEALAKEINRSRKKTRALKNWRETRVLIVDEVSMLDAELFDKLEEIARLVRGRFRLDHQTLPFGGLQVVLCGDFAQLPPVKAKGGFCFQSGCWNRVINPRNQIELVEVIRQSEGPFRMALGEIRMGEVSKETQELLRSRVGAKVGTDLIKPTILLSLRNVVKRKNEEELAKIEDTMREFKAQDRISPYPKGGESVARSMIERANKNLQPREVVRLKVGAQVMLIFNHSDTLVNGSRGVVIGYQQGWPVVQFINGESIVALPHCWRVKVGDKTYMEREQVPLILAWSVTIHKCVSPNTLVPTSNGLAYMSELVTNDDGWASPKQEIMVASRKGWERISQIFKGSEEPSIVVRTRMGFELEGSVRHPVLVVTSEGQETWKLLPNIEIGDVLVMRRDCGAVVSELIETASFTATSRVPVVPVVPVTHITEDLAWVFGFLVGDGSYHDTKDGTVDVTNNDTQLLDRFTEICERDLGVRVCAYNNRRYFCRQEVREFFLDCGFDYVTAQLKKVPWIIRRSPRSVQHAFLKGLYDADGVVNRLTIHFTTASKTLAKEVHLMLLHSAIVGMMVEMPNDFAGSWRVETTGAQSRLFMEMIGFMSMTKNMAFKELNVASRVSTSGVPKSNIGALPDSEQVALRLQNNHELTKTNRLSQHVSACIRGKSRLHVFHIPYLRTHLQNLELTDVGRDMLSRDDDSIFYDSVVDVGTGRCVMLDLEVENQHAFVTNGIMSHNCQGATLDCVEIDISRCFEHGQAYVALSRVRSLEGLSLKSGDLSRITVHPIVKKFYSDLRGMREAPKPKPKMKPYPVNAKPPPIERRRPKRRVVCLKLKPVKASPKRERESVVKKEKNTPKRAKKKPKNKSLKLKPVKASPKRERESVVKKEKNTPKRAKKKPKNKEEK
jgi:hypothetical protein